MTDIRDPSFPTATGDKLTATRVPLGQLRFVQRTVDIPGLDRFGNPVFVG